jgi:hypothetical protein
MDDDENAALTRSRQGVLSDHRASSARSKCQPRTPTRRPQMGQSPDPTTFPRRNSRTVNPLRRDTERTQEAVAKPNRRPPIARIVDPNRYLPTICVKLRNEPNTLPYGQTVNLLHGEAPAMRQSPSLTNIRRRNPRAANPLRRDTERTQQPVTRPDGQTRAWNDRPNATIPQNEWSRVRWLFEAIAEVTPETEASVPRPASGRGRRRRPP